MMTVSQAERASGRFALPAGFRKGALASLGLLPGLLAFGAVFGMLAVQSGMAPGEAMLSSGIVFAGASQFMALDMWGPELSFWTIVITTFIINMRHMLMGAALRPWFRTLPPHKACAILFFMVDESWALTIGSKVDPGERAGFLLGSGMLLWANWMTATFIGAYLVSSIEDPAVWGLDFVFGAAFIALLVGVYRGREDILPWTVVAVVAVACERFLPGKWYILIGGLAGGFVEAMRHEGSSGSQGVARTVAASDADTDESTREDRHDD